MKGNSKASHALAVLASTPLAEKGRAKEWSKLVAAQLDELHRQERMTPRRAIAIGLMLHAVKASLKHGEFTPWLKETLTALKFGTLGTAQVKSSYYMRLAIAFVQERKLTAPELAALPAGGGLLDLEATRGNAAKLVQHLDEFCGESSLAELIATHLKSKGGGGGGGDDTTTQATEMATQWLLDLRQTYLNPDKVKLYPRAHLKSVEKQAASFLSEYRKLLADLGVSES